MGLPYYSKTAPIAQLLGSVWISKGCLKFGSARTGTELIFSFKVSKAFCCLPPHWKTCLTLVTACNGVAMEEKLAINFLQY
jgi:hypothetical protein